jgi:tetratricopeptide (TPR) repeat protein
LSARQLVVKTCTEFLDRLASEKRDDRALQFDLARAWCRISMIQSSLGLAGLGQTVAALQSAERSIAIVRDLLRNDPGNSELRGFAIDAHIRKTEVLICLHRLSEARTVCEAIANQAEELSSGNPGALSFEFSALSAHNRLAEIDGRMGDYDAALDQYRRAVVIGEKLAREWSGHDDIQASLGASLQQLSRMLGRCGQFEEAVDTQHRAIEIFERLEGRDPTRVYWRREIGACRSVLANAYELQGCVAEARVELRQSFEILTSLNRNDPTNAVGLADSANLVVQCASFELEDRDYAEAIKFARAASASFEDLVRADPENLDVRREFAVAHGYLGSALAGSGRLEEALRAYAISRDELEALAAAEPSDALVELDFHYCSAKMGRAFRSRADELADDPDARAEALHAAHERLARGIEGLRGMKRSSITKRGDLRIGEFERDLERCDADLARIGDARRGVAESPR